MALDVKTPKIIIQAIANLDASMEPSYRRRAKDLIDYVRRQLKSERITTSQASSVLDWIVGHSNKDPKVIPKKPVDLRDFFQFLRPISQMPIIPKIPDPFTHLKFDERKQAGRARTSFYREQIDLPVKRMVEESYYKLPLQERREIFSFVSYNTKLWVQLYYTANRKLPTTQLASEFFRQFNNTFSNGFLGILRAHRTGSRLEIKEAAERIKQMANRGRRFVIKFSNPGYFQKRSMGRSMVRTKRVTPRRIRIIKARRSR